MNGMSNVQDFLFKYKIEFILLTVSIVVSVFSIFLYLKATVVEKKENIVFYDSKDNKTKSVNISIDVTGSVLKPDLYILREGTRLKEALDKAGGLSENADWNFFYRNFNLSRILVDQEKIYIPSVEEIEQGVILQNVRTIDYFNQNNSQTNNIYSNPDNLNLVNINSSSLSQLEDLPGIGPSLANKITNARPYNSLNDLIDRKILSVGQYEKVKDYLTL